MDWTTHDKERAANQHWGVEPATATATATWAQCRSGTKKGHHGWVGEGSAGYWDHWVHWGCKDIAFKLASIDPAINTITAICMAKIVATPPKGQRMRPMQIAVLTCLIEDYGHVAFVQKYNLEAVLMRNAMEAGI